MASQSPRSTTRSGALDRAEAHGIGQEVPHDPPEGRDERADALVAHEPGGPEAGQGRGDLVVEDQGDRGTAAHRRDSGHDDGPWPAPPSATPGRHGLGEPHAGDDDGHGGRAGERDHRDDGEGGELSRTGCATGHLPDREGGAGEQDVDLVLLDPGRIDDAERCERDARRHQHAGQPGQPEATGQRVGGRNGGDAGDEGGHLGPDGGAGAEHEHRAIDQVGAGGGGPHLPGLPDPDVAGEGHPGVVAPQALAGQPAAAQGAAERSDDDESGQGQPAPGAGRGFLGVSRRSSGASGEGWLIGARRRCELGRVGAEDHHRRPRPAGRPVVPGPRPPGRDVPSPTSFSRQVGGRA